MWCHWSDKLFLMKKKINAFQLETSKQETLGVVDMEGFIHATELVSQKISLQSQAW